MRSIDRPGVVCSELRFPSPCHSSQLTSFRDRRSINWSGIVRRASAIFLAFVLPRGNQEEGASFRAKARKIFTRRRARLEQVTGAKARLTLARIIQSRKKHDVLLHIVLRYSPRNEFPRPYLYAER